MDWFLESFRFLPSSKFTIITIIMGLFYTSTVFNIQLLYRDMPHHDLLQDGLDLELSHDNKGKAHFHGPGSWTRTHPLKTFGHSGVVEILFTLTAEFVTFLLLRWDQTYMKIVGRENRYVRT